MSRTRSSPPEDVLEELSLSFSLTFLGRLRRHILLQQNWWGTFLLHYSSKCLVLFESEWTGSCICHFRNYGYSWSGLWEQLVWGLTCFSYVSLAFECGLLEQNCNSDFGFRTAVLPQLVVQTQFWTVLVRIDQDREMYEQLCLLFSDHT